MVEDDQVLRRLEPGAAETFRQTSTMPVPTTVQHEKNIWIAAGDGDLERVRVRKRSLVSPLSCSKAHNVYFVPQELIEVHCL